MSGLVLKLGPRERILINGAVIENGDRRSRLNIVTPNANILRLKDAIHPDEANTPVRRVCYITQLVLSGDVDPDEGEKQIAAGIAQLSQAFTDADSLEQLRSAAVTASAGQFYQALKHLRSLLPTEAHLLNLPPS
ncbi:MAG: flagellar biosynthesis repressor FlbT [Pseudomonadota bacterium]